MGLAPKVGRAVWGEAVGDHDVHARRGVRWDGQRHLPVPTSVWAVSADDERITQQIEWRNEAGAGFVRGRTRTPADRERRSWWPRGRIHAERLDGCAGVAAARHGHHPGHGQDQRHRHQQRSAHNRPPPVVLPVGRTLSRGMPPRLVDALRGQGTGQPAIKSVVRSTYASSTAPSSRALRWPTSPYTGSTSACSAFWRWRANRSTRDCDLAGTSASPGKVTKALPVSRVEQLDDVEDGSSGALDRLKGGVAGAACRRCVGGEED